MLCADEGTNPETAAVHRLRYTQTHSQTDLCSADKAQILY